MKNFILLLVIICSLFHDGISLSDGTYSTTCDKIILQKYNVNPTSCSSDFIIKSSTSSYKNNSPIRITITSIISTKTFSGVYIFAQDSKSNNVGSWKKTDLLTESTSCGGLMHSSQAKKTYVETIWYAPSGTIGEITIKAIIIEDEKTIYVNCYNILLTPQVIEQSLNIDGNDLLSDNTTTTMSPPANTTTSTVSSSTTSTVTMSTTSTTEASTTSTIPTTTTTILSTTTTIPTTSTTVPSTTTSTLITTTQVLSTTTTLSPVANVSVNVTWVFNGDSNITDVCMTISNLQSGGWAAIGLALKQGMGEAHVFMCKRLANDDIIIERYINPHDHQYPEHAGSEQGGTFTPGHQQFDSGVVTCRFTLSNFSFPSLKKLKDIQPLSQSTSYYPLFAVGLLDDSDEPNKHPDDSMTAQNGLVQLNQQETILYRIDNPDNDDGLRYFRVHGTLMIFAWILIASTGAVIARYFKGAWANSFICGKAPWFALHRFFMSIGIILTILGFLFVLVADGGQWVGSDEQPNYSHSVLGAMVVGFAFFQPFTALFRCEANSPNRYIFNFIHAFFGFSSFILGTAAIFLATYFDLLKDTKARVIMIIWIVWTLFVFVMFEILKYRARKRDGSSAYRNIDVLNGDFSESASPTQSALTAFPSSQETTSGQKAKNALLALHILVAAILSIVLAIFINTSL